MLPGDRGPGEDRHERLHRGARATAAQVVEHRTGMRASHVEQGADRRKRWLRATRHRLRERFPGEPLKDGITRILLDALAAQKWKVRRIEIARAPPEQRGIERHDERGAAAGFRAREETSDQFIGATPIELKPARRISHDRRGALHRLRRLVRKNHRQPARGGRGGHGDIGLRVRQQERRRQALAEELDARIARGDVAQHAWDNLPAIKRAAVRVHGPLQAGPAGEIRERRG